MHEDSNDIGLTLAETIAKHPGVAHLVVREIQGHPYLPMFRVTLETPGPDWSADRQD